MPIVQDTLWKHPGNPGMIVVSCHATVMEDGRLSLEWGEAQEAVRRIPEIEFQCGQEVLAHAVDRIYGFLPVRPPRPEDRVIGFGIFQTRVNLNDTPDLELIRYSMDCLRRYTDMQPNLKIRMNFPGVGPEGLEVDKVSPLLLPLPRTITLCHQGEVQPTMPSNFPGFKMVYIEIERMLQDGKYNQAVEYLMKNGFDIQSAMNQVSAVQRMLSERLEKDSARAKAWRQTHFSFLDRENRRSTTVDR